METIIHAPLPVRSMSVNHYYFAKNKETAKTVVSYMSDTYRTVCNPVTNTVLIFGSDSSKNEILWLPEDTFYEKYTVIGRVNRVIFE